MASGVMAGCHCKQLNPSRSQQNRIRSEVMSKMSRAETMGAGEIASNFKLKLSVNCKTKNMWHEKNSQTDGGKDIQS